MCTRGEINAQRNERETGKSEGNQRRSERSLAICTTSIVMYITISYQENVGKVKVKGEDLKISYLAPPCFGTNI